jgi:nucleotide-binding universal stress UspA family protein
MYRTILVPVDGSEAASLGLREAVRLARRLGSRLVLLNVVEDYSHEDVLETASFSPGLFRLLRDRGERIVARAAAAAKRAGVAAKTRVSERPGWRTFDQIVEAATRERASLIVLGTHGRRGMRRLVMGSDAEQVVRFSPVPVLLVRAKERAKRRGRRA